LAYEIGRLVGHLGEHSQTRLTLHQRNDSLLMPRTNHGIAFPIAEASRRVTTIGGRSPMGHLSMIWPRLERPKP